MRKWGIYSLADAEMLQSLYDSEQEAWEAIDECGTDLDLAPVPVLLGGIPPDDCEEEGQKALSTFKVEFLSSRDYRARIRDSDATVTVLQATVEAEDHDDAVLKTHERSPDAIVMATYKREPTDEGLKAGIRP